MTDIVLKKTSNTFWNLEMSKTVEHYLCDVEYPNEVKKNLCSEISLPVLLDKNCILMLQLQGATVFNYTEQLCMEPEQIKVEQNE